MERDLSNKRKTLKSESFGHLEDRSTRHLVPLKNSSNNHHSESGDSLFQDELSGSRSCTSSGSGPTIGFGKKNESVYGDKGDLLWKTLVVTLLLFIGTAAGFVYLYGLVLGDVQSTNLVSTALPS